MEATPAPNLKNQPRLHLGKFPNKIFEMYRAPNQMCDIDYWLG